MNYSQAVKGFEEGYRDRYKVEFPVIFNLCDFNRKSVLEIGAGRDGYFPEKVLGFVKKYMATDISQDILDELKKKVNVETRVCRAENFLFQINPLI